MNTSMFIVVRVDSQLHTVVSEPMETEKEAKGWIIGNRAEILSKMIQNSCRPAEETFFLNQPKPYAKSVFQTETGDPVETYQWTTHEVFTVPV